MPRVRGQVDGTLLGSLAGDDQPAAGAREVRAIEGQRFRDAAAGADQELDQGAVPFLARGTRRQGGEQAGQLVRVDGLGQPLLELGQRYAVRQVALGDALASDPAQPGADGHQRAGTGSRALEAPGEVTLVSWQVLAAEDLESA